MRGNQLNSKPRHVERAEQGHRDISIGARSDMEKFQKLGKLSPFLGWIFVMGFKET